MPKVLVVDDERSLRLLIQATLAAGGFQVLQATDGEAALEIVRRERPALVLLDVQMPGIDGIEACRRIKSDPDLAGTTVLMLTAQGRGEASRRASDAGADAFLSKPFSPLQLLELVERVVHPR